MPKHRIAFLIVIALLVALVALPVAAQSFPNPGTGSTYTELANKTGNAATVQLTYYDTSGGIHQGPQRNIPGNGSTAIDPDSVQLPQNFQGSAVVSSNQPLASVVTTKWTGGPGDGFQMGTYSGVSAGSTEICFPSMWKVNDILISSFAIQNTGTAPVTVQLNYRSRQGVDNGTYTDTIPAGAQHTYDLRNPGTGVPDLTSPWDGSVKAVVQGSGSIAGVSVANWGSSNPDRVRSATYNAVDCAGLSGNTVLEVPAQYRVVINNQWVVWSALNIQNLENSPAHVTVQYTPRSNSNPSKTINYTIPANTTVGMNTRNGGTLPPDTFNDLGEGWDGTAEITSDKAVVATVITAWGRAGGVYYEAGIYTAADKNRGATKYFVPDYKRVKDGDTWKEWSAAVVQNLGNSDAHVSLKFYDRNGTLKLQFNNEVIGSLSAIGYNSRFGGTKPPADFDPLGTSFEGHVVIESDQPLSVVLNSANWLSNPPFRGATGTTNAIPE